MISPRHNRIRMITALLLLLSGCASTNLTRNAEYLKPPVQAFYATNRNHAGQAESGQKYGAERSMMSYGIAEVAIPQDHRIGRVIHATFDKEKHREIDYLQLTEINREELLNNLTKTVAACEEKALLLYVHGFNMTFNEGARGIGQVVSDLDFKGSSLFFSWPSRGHVNSYEDDEAGILWAEKDLMKLLEEVALRSGSKTIYLMGHSLGARGLSRALLELLGKNPQLKTYFKALILTAPDINADVFKNEIGPALAKTGVRVTLYVSGKDRALTLSERVHGVRRLGNANGKPIIIPGIETVDATNINTGFLGHSYHSDSRSVLSDIYYILKKDLRADERFSLKAIDTASGRYWIFKD